VVSVAGQTDRGGKQAGRHPANRDGAASTNMRENRTHTSRDQGSHLYNIAEDPY